MAARAYPVRKTTKVVGVNVESKEDLYKAVVRGLRELGYDDFAECIESDQFTIYGNPSAPKPEGIIEVHEQDITWHGPVIEEDRPEDCPMAFDETCYSCGVGACFGGVIPHAATIEWMDLYTSCVLCHRPLRRFTISQLTAKGFPPPPWWPEKRLQPCQTHQKEESKD